MKAMTEEAVLQRHCMEILKASGLLWWRVPNGAVKHSGVMKKSPMAGHPDLAGLLPSGRYFAIELKASKGILQANQVEWIEKIKASGGLAVVIRSVDEILNFLEKAKS